MYEADEHYSERWEQDKELIEFLLDKDAVLQSSHVFTEP